MGFEEALAFTLLQEGGLSDDVSDRGGLTKYGISQASYPDLDIRKLTLQDAKAIYRRDYWDSLGLDGFPETLAMAMFDTAVNSGIGRSVKLLQQILNQHGSSPQLAVDGDLGSKTLQAYNVWEDSGSDVKDLVFSFLMARIEFLKNICAKDRTQIKFIIGWINRVIDLHKALK
jgi:lysozyme family protein